ncbi:hypothetical protein BKA70DRAFT_232688 [Coprinopsis sp. MPI-PUGE-AT-0042]|nr:hypothetical protein BKA70DRAFT_232688 [Coprinopsis sp. MPI-PUGE-AT-0042]
MDVYPSRYDNVPQQMGHSDLRSDPYYVGAEYSSSCHPLLALTNFNNGNLRFFNIQRQRVGSWAARHGHTSILDEAAPWMTSLPLVKALGVFPGHITLAWAEYYTSWEKVKSIPCFTKIPHDANLNHCNIRSTQASNGSRSSSWLAASFTILGRLREGWEEGQNPFLDLDKLFDSPMCERTCCKRGLATWKSCTQVAVNNLPKVSQFIWRRLEK